MCKTYEGCRKMYNTSQIMAVIDEVASAAASLGQGAQSYDAFIKSREKCTKILDEYNSYISDVQNQVTKLLKVI